MNVGHTLGDVQTDLQHGNLHEGQAAVKVTCTQSNANWRGVGAEAKRGSRVAMLRKARQAGWLAKVQGICARNAN